MEELKKVIKSLSKKADETGGMPFDGGPFSRTTHSRFMALKKAGCNLTGCGESTPTPAYLLLRSRGRQAPRASRQIVAGSGTNCTLSAV